MEESNVPATVRDLTRRRFLQATGATGVAAFLAACGGGLGTATPTATAVPTGTPPPGQSPSPTPQPTPSPTLGGTLHWANWPAYIDLTGAAADAGKYAPGSSPTIVNFQKQTGITVDYQEKIEDNAHFFATIQPQLVAGLSTGWDLIVMTDWMAAKLISKGWIEKIDHGAVPNCVANLRDPLKGLSWDPGNDYHYPWQSGMTGIGYDSKALTTNQITPPASIADLFTIATAHAKNVSFLTESRDTFGLVMLKLGLDPSHVTVATLQQAHDAMRPLVDAGVRFADNSYLQDFAQGKTWAAMVWSGDLAGSGTADEHFVFPTEGVMIWSDNMLIPKGAQNQPAAQAMMNYVYDPQIAGNLANAIYYVSPVKGADAVVKQLNASAPLDPTVQNLLFPGPDVVAKQHAFQAPLDADTEDTLNNLYLDLSGG
jgi:spermidine/putrescine transport system substrate-binding protein